MSRALCNACGREFQSAAAFPVKVQVGRRQGWAHGCPGCYAWDDSRQLAVKVPGGHYGPHAPR